MSKFLFSALALAFCLSLLASFVVAMTVIPLFCSRFLKGVHHEPDGTATYRLHLRSERFNAWFNAMFNRSLDFYERCVRRALRRPALTLAALLGVFAGSLAIYPLLGPRHFSPRPMPGNSRST